MNKTVISIISTIIAIFMFVCYIYMLVHNLDQEAFAFLIATVIFGCVPVVNYLEGAKDGKDRA